MQIWLKQDIESLRLPVLPPGFDITKEQQNTTVNINSLGEINLIGKRRLKTLSLSSLFPNQQYNFVQYTGFPDPYECVKLIDSWMDNPIQVIITGADVSILMSIESFVHSRQDGTGDVYYTLELKEYYKPGQGSLVSSAVNKSSVKIRTASTKRSAKTLKSTIYTVKSGDKLYTIAKKLTGDGNNCWAIANQNNISNPESIKVGQKLVIRV